MEFVVPKKKKLTLDQAASRLAKIAMARLADFSEEEQEARISAAERLVANASRVGTPRKSSSNLRTLRNRAVARSR
jgi:hypothetical protein